jgi:hypothetical protein
MIVKNNTIREYLASLKSNTSDKLNEIKSKTFKEKFGGLAKSIFAYSKRVLTLEGVVESESANKPTATDLALAKAISKDVIGGGWEGSGQAMNRIFSIFLGRNLNSKEVGLTCRIDLPKGTIIKRKNGTIGIISEKSNLQIISGAKLTKDTSFEKYNQDISLPSENEMTIFVGTILNNPDLLRNFASAFKVSTLDEFENMIATSSNGLDTEDSDNMNYKKFITGNMNPDITITGVAS